MKKYCIDDFSISRVSKDRYRISFFFPYWKEQRTIICTANQLAAKVKQKDCVIREQLIKCFEEDIFNKLIVSTEYDDVQSNLMQLMTELYKVNQVSVGGIVSYELSSQQFCSIMAYAQKMGEALGIDDIHRLIKPTESLSLITLQVEEPPPLLLTESPPAEIEQIDCFESSEQYNSAAYYSVEDYE